MAAHALSASLCQLWFGPWVTRLSMMRAWASVQQRWLLMSSHTEGLSIPVPAGAGLGELLELRL